MLRRLLAVVALDAIALVALEMLWPPRFEQLLGVDESVLVRLLGLATAAGYGAATAGAWLSRHVRRWTGTVVATSTVAQLLQAAALTTLALGAQPSIAVAGFLVAHLALGVFHPTVQTELHAFASDEHRTTMISAGFLTCSSAPSRPSSRSSRWPAPPASPPPGSPPRLRAGSRTRPAAHRRRAGPFGPSLPPPPEPRMTRPDVAGLEAVLTDLGALGFDLALVEEDPGAGWIRLDRYLADPTVLDAGLRLAGTRFHVPETSATTGGWLIGDIAAAVAWPAAAAMLTHATVLFSRTTDVYLPVPNTARRLTGRIAAPRSSAPTNPGTFADGMVATLRPVVEAVHARTRRGRHALWGTVTDMVAAAFHRVGDHLDRSGEAHGLADTVIDGCQTLIGGANWHDVVWSGGVEHTRVRNICCLWYRTPGGELCLTCPRLTDRDRVRILDHRASPH
jgi:hypothetical protein